MVYEHESPSTVWKVKHHLNTPMPRVECWVNIDGADIKILPFSIESNDTNTITITFTRPYTGKTVLHSGKRWSDK